MKDQRFVRILTLISLIISMMTGIVQADPSKLIKEGPQTKPPLKTQDKPKKPEVISRPTQSFSSSNRSLNFINEHSFGIGVGETFISGDLSKYGNDSITIDGFYSYSASYSFDFITNFHYSNHQNEKQKVGLRSLNFGIKGKFYQYDSFSPYLIGGLGFYRPRVTQYTDDGELKQSESKTAFGIHAGLGAPLRLNRMLTIGLLGQFHNPFDITQDNGEKSVTGRYFKLLMTMMISL